MKKYTIIPCLLAITLGCSSKPEHSEQKLNKNKKTIFKYQVRANPSTFDPMKVTDTITPPVLKQIYEGLVKLDKNNQLMPALAKSWEVTPDKRSYLFHLQKGVLFHNRQLLTAEDVKWSLERACEPKIASPNAKQFLGDIVGAREKLEGKTHFISGIEVINSHTVKVTLREPIPCFLYKLTHLVASILPKSQHPYIEITKPEDIVGTGPYKFQNYQNNQHITLLANERYHGERPKNGGVSVSIVKDVQTIWNSFQAGKTHLCYLPIPQAYAYKQQDPTTQNGRLYSVPLAGICYFELNPRAYKPFQDVKIRQAIAMSINRNWITQNLMKNMVEPAHSIIHPLVPGYRNKVQGINYNPIIAKKQLTIATRKYGKELPPLKIYVRAGFTNSKIVAENTAMQLRNKLGINASVSELESSAYQQKILQQKLPMRITVHFIDYPDPSNALADHFASYSDLNTSGYSNLEFDRICKLANQKTGQERLKLYARAEDILLQDAVAIPLHYVCDYWLSSPRVKGLAWNAYQGGFLPFSSIEIK